MEDNAHNENISISQYSDPVQQAFEEYKDILNNMTNQIVDIWDKDTFTPADMGFIRKQIKTIIRYHEYDDYMLQAIKKGLQNRLLSKQGFRSLNDIDESSRNRLEQTIRDILQSVIERKRNLNDTLAQVSLEIGGVNSLLRIEADMAGDELVLQPEGMIKRGIANMIFKLL